MQECTGGPQQIPATVNDAGVTFAYDTSGQLEAVLQGWPNEATCLAGAPDFKLSSCPDLNRVTVVCEAGADSP
jgi:hypothetical protein